MTEPITPVEVPSFVALTVGMTVYFLGATLTRRWRPLRDFNIPEPVSGGLVVALFVLLVRATTGQEITFELDARDTLLVVFFATIGLNARLSDLLRVGRPLVILLGLTVAFMVLQNIVALAGTQLFGLPAALGVMLGSASLVGGHGTAIAWGPVLVDSYGIAGAAELGIAAATLGLVLAALVGGPISRYLIGRHGLRADPDDTAVVGLTYEREGIVGMDAVALMRTLLTINITIIIGYFVNLAVAEAGLMLPLFVPCLIMGIVIANLQPRLLPGTPAVSGTPMLAVISEFALSVFLAMSLMSMQLWTLAGTAGPLFVVLFLQAALAVLFSIFVLFRLMGADYRAAVLAAGFGGFALGATPTAIANMTAVTKRHGPSPLAFIILPLVSAFFVDLANALIIKVFVSL